jgi:AraC-like DNA-binding protein
VQSPVAELLSDFEAELGLRLVFHDWFSLSDLPEEKRVHTHAFCLRVKEEHERECVAWDLHRPLRTMHQYPLGRILTCPFGATEIQIPVQLNGRMFGVLFGGPFFTHRAGQATSLERKRRVLIALADQLAQRLDRACGDPSGDRKREILRMLRDRTTHTIRDLAEGLSLSEDRCRHVIKQLFGKAFSDLLLETRMSGAARQLLNGEQSITRIALDAGFSDPGYFSRRFKKAMGMSPRAFRKQSLRSNKV